MLFPLSNLPLVIKNSTFEGYDLIDKHVDGDSNYQPLGLKFIPYVRLDALRGQGPPENGKVGNGIGFKIRNKGNWVGHQAEWHKQEPRVASVCESPNPNKRTGM